IPEEFGGGGFGGREFHVIMEELAWGSPGLAMAFGVDIMPALLALMTFDDDVEESYVRPYLENDERHQGC
ncbi:MAG: acyl-CoA dehydrogenase family protein, partial [Halobacteria archaeon]|nr:acyl-CoA dehydrogenase family protein [Halobacteria archaeon]